MVRDYTTKVPIYPDKNIKENFIELKIDGTLTLKSGFAWDENVFKDQNVIISCAIKKAIYQLVYHKNLEVKYIEVIDDIFIKEVEKKNSKITAKIKCFLSDRLNKYSKKHFRNIKVVN